MKARRRSTPPSRRRKAKPAARRSFTLAGEGKINNRPFNRVFSGAPLLNVRRDPPYAVEADVRAGATRVKAEGAIARPFDFNHWSAEIDAAGADLADLYELIGLALPNTPPYSVRGRLERKGTRFGMPRLSGRVGDSDLAGAWTAARQRNGRMLFEGDFRSSDLDFDDLASVLGGAPSTARGETASPEQRQMARNLEAQGRLLPDATLDMKRVRNMDARVSFSAARVRLKICRCGAWRLRLRSIKGCCIDPMTLHLTRGRVGGGFDRCARGYSARCAGRQAERRAGGAADCAAIRRAGHGRAAGRVRLSGRGASVRRRGGAPMAR